MRPSEQIITLLGRASNTPVLLSAPNSSFLWTPNTFRTPSGVYTNSFNPDSYIPAITTTYWVDTVNGNGGNSGLTPSLPKNTLSACLIAANVDQVRIKATGTQAANGAYIMWGNRSWGAQAPTRSISVVPDDGVSRFVSVASATNAAPTWTKTAGLTNVYQTTAAGSAVNGPTDLKFLAGTGSNANVQGYFLKPQLAASAAACDAAPNLYFYDQPGGILYVSASLTADPTLGQFRSLIGDLYMTGVTTAANGFLTTNAANTLYVKGMDFVCGQPFIANQSAAPAGASPIIVMVDCSGQGSNANVNGFNFNGKYDVYLVQCSAANNYGDGLGGYHALNGVSGRYFEDRCRTGFNGYLGSSNQSSSAHDDFVGLTQNPDYYGAASQCINDIINAQRWLQGGRLRPPVDTGISGNTLQLGANVKMFLDGTIVEAAGTFTLGLSGASSVLSYRNNPAIATATITGPGTLQTY